MDVSQFLANYSWAFQAFAIIFIALLASYIEARIHKKILPRLEARNHPWQLSLAQSFHAPFHALIWFVGIMLAAQIAAAQADDFPLCEFFVPFRNLGVGLLLVWFLLRLTRQFEKNLMETKKDKKRLDETSIKAIGQLLRVSILITAILIILQSFGVPISGVVAFGGISAAAVGFAAKDLLANFFGAFMIYLDRPFAIGEWIRSPESNIEGVVEDIGWRLTRLRTFDKRPLFVPNAVFSNIAIENASRMRNRRIKTTIGVRYDDAERLPTILADMQEMVANHPEIDTKLLAIVNFVEFGPSSLDMQIYAFTKTTNYANFLSARQDIYLKSLAIIAKHGAEVAFPTQTIHLDKKIDLM